MKHADFKLGTLFTTDEGRKRWRCTDVGSRVIIAILLEPGKEDWLHGPPYAIPECVFDEYSLPGCEPI